MLSDGARWLTNQLAANCSDPVTYSRGAITMIAMATRGSTTFESNDNEGAILLTESRDFITDACKLLAKFGRPQPGDVINDGKHNFEVLSIPGGQPFRFCDRHETLLRIHTKQIG